MINTNKNLPKAGVKSENEKNLIKTDNVVKSVADNKPKDDKKVEKDDKKKIEKLTPNPKEIKE